MSVRSAGCHFEHAVVEALGLALQRHREALLAHEQDRGARALVEVAHELDQLPLHQVVALVEDQRLLREHQLLADLVDHLGDGGSGLMPISVRIARGTPSS
jgi:hypothetical protein